MKHRSLTTIKRYRIEYIRAITRLQRNRKKERQICENLITRKCLLEHDTRKLISAKISRFTVHGVIITREGFEDTSHCGFVRKIG